MVARTSNLCCWTFFNFVYFVQCIKFSEWECALCTFNYILSLYTVLNRAHTVIVTCFTIVTISLAQNDQVVKLINVVIAAHYRAW